MRSVGSFGFAVAPLVLVSLVLSRIGTGQIGAANTAVNISVNVDAAADRHAISPLIYGIATDSGLTGWQKDMGATIARWGGNARTRENWEINATNAGSDWFYTNMDLAGGNRTPGEESRAFVANNKANEAASLLTIPLIGWVAKDVTSRSTGVPAQGGPPVSPGSEAIAGYDPTANRNTTSLPSYPTKGSAFTYPPDLSDNAVYQDEWVNYLVNAFGTAQNGGVGFYAMDNEIDLWADATHVDVHPVRVGYDETRTRTIEYAEAIKAVDPTAQITGPVIWGWIGLWYSGLDRGADNFLTHADRLAHGNVPYLQWFLRQLKAHDLAAGHRTLDMLDVHWYPQGLGVYSGSLDPATQALRLRSPRSLWDPAYIEESWIAGTEGGPFVRLIPRLKEMIAAEYPGTKLGITEWNFGADSDINGALAIGDVLGIYGRESLDLANYWTSPENGRPGYWAWRMYRNYDGAFSKFGDISVRAQSSDDYGVSAYASENSVSGNLKVMLINKSPDTAANMTLSVNNYNVGAVARAYQYSAADVTQIHRLADLQPAAGSIYCSLPAYSMTLLVFGNAPEMNFQTYLPTAHKSSPLP